MKQTELKEASEEVRYQYNITESMEQTHKKDPKEFPLVEPITKTE